MSVIALESLSFAYGDLPVLSDITMRVEEGEFVGIIGPNGGGKSTLFQLILGFLHPGSGSVTLFGKEPVETRHRVGYVPQRLDYDAQFPISTLELVLGGRLQQTRWCYNRTDRAAALQALERVGLAGTAHKPYRALSGGQAQRALIARALCGEPDLLLLDEPVSCVDTEGERDFYSLLSQLRPKVTILMVTHHLDLAVQHVDRILAVHRTLEPMAPGEVCDHFGLGLYEQPQKKRIATDEHR